MLKNYLFYDTCFIYTESYVFLHVS